MILPIITYENPILKKKSIDITEQYKGLNLLIDNMFQTLKNSNGGVGLAAPQIGLNI